jgi:hypothetical protein
VLIQLLLNRAGDQLKVDGIFGRRTLAALIEFQRRNRVNPDGVVGPTTWRELPRGDNTNVVDVVDVGDPKTLGPAVMAFEKAGGHPIQLGLMCAGVEQMAHDIASRSNGRGNIALLRVMGHGNRGRWMTVSVGDVVDLSQSEYAIWRTEYHSYLDLEHADEVLPVLSFLRGYFAPYGMMEHGGCSLGGQPKTRQLMRKLADLWNVPVSAGVGVQHSFLNFDGQVFTAYPRDGSLESWSEQFRQASY